MNLKRILCYFMLVLLVISTVFPMTVRFASAYTYSPVYIAQHNATYPRIMLPRIITMKNGNLLACYIANPNAGGDNTYARLYTAKSTDNGATWNSKTLVVNGNPGHWGACEGSFIVNGSKIMLFYSKWHQLDNASPHPHVNSTLYQLNSYDNGTTWSGNTSINTGHQYTLATNNGFVMQDGTLIRSYAWVGTGTNPTGYGVYNSSSLKSTDGGVTWVNGGNAYGAGIGTQGLDEPTSVELSNHTLYMLMRNTLTYLYKSYSTDKGVTWTTPVASQFTATSTPACLYRYSWSPNKILVSWDNSASYTPLVIDQSTNDMVSTLGLTTVTASGYPVRYPSITNASDGNIVVAWWDLASSNDDAYSRRFSSGSSFATSPTVTTNAPTGVEETNATLSGYISNDAGENCIVGFDYGTTVAYGTSYTSPYDGYIYGGGDTTDKVYQYWASNMTKKAETVSYGGVIQAILTDNNYIYVGGATTQKVSQYWRSNMTYRQQSASYGGVIWAMAQDSTYIYEAGYTTNKVYQLWKSNLSKKAETVSYGTGAITSLCEDTTFVYAGGGNPYKVDQFYKSDMTLKAQSASYGGTIWSMTFDQNYVYAGGLTTNAIRQYWTSNMTLKATSATYGNTIDAVAQDTLYVYAGGEVTQKVYQYWKSNLSKRAESISYKSTIVALVADGTYVYYGGYVTQTVNQSWASNMTKKKASANYGGTVLAVTASRTLYNTGNTFTYPLTGLSPGTGYHYRATVNNGLAGYGLDVPFVTEPNDPTGLTATVISSSQINLAWTNGAGANKTYIVKKIGSYPSSITDGSNICNVTGTSYNDTGISPGTHWFYSAWSYSQWGTAHQWGDATSNANATTTSNFVPSLGTPSPTNGSTGQTLLSKTTIIANTGGDGDSLTLTWFNNATSSWINYGHNNSVANGTYRQPETWASGYLTEYWWKVTVNDGTVNVTYIYHFTTLGNGVPILSAPSPSNNSIGQALSVKTTIVANTGGDADSLTITWFNNKTGSWINYGHNNSVGNGTYRWTEAWASSYGTRYWWKVTITDGTVNVTYWYKFTTNTIPTLSTPSPSNGSTGQARLVSTSIIANTGGDSDSLTLTWYNNKTGGWVNYGHNNSVANGTYLQSDTWASSYTTEYWWKVSIYDGTSNISSVYHFTTGTNGVPILSSPSPGNASTGQSKSVRTVITANTGGDADLLTLTWFNNKTGAWVNYGHNNSVTNGTYKQSETWASIYNTEYWWKVTIFDGTTNITYLYHFTTKADTPPSFTGESPSNSSIGVALSLASWSITINDIDADTFNWTIQTSPNVGSSSANGATNGSKSDAIAGLAYSTLYKVYVNATDGTAWTRAWYKFTTVSAPVTNTPPSITSPYPMNGSVNVSKPPLYFKLTISDIDGDKMNITWKTNVTTGTWHTFNTTTNKYDGTYYAFNKSWASIYSHRYYWKVIVNDGMGGWTNATYKFNVSPNVAPVILSVSPSNSSILSGSTLSSIAVTIGDIYNDSLNVTWQADINGTWRTLNTSIGVHNGTYTAYNTSFVSAPATTYHWRLIVRDLYGLYKNASYLFTTYASSSPGSPGSGGGFVLPHTNTNTNSSTPPASKGIPGFEVVLLFVAVALCILISRRRKR